MVRNITALALIGLLVAGVGVAGETAWLDWQNCDMCSNMDPALFDHMTWEQYDISDGVVSLTIVEQDYIGSYRTASMKMMEVGKEMQSGKQVKLCGSCTELGMCMAKGAVPEFVPTSSGSVMIITASDPKVVAEIKAWSQKNKDEMAKMKS